MTISKILLAIAISSVTCAVNAQDTTSVTTTTTPVTTTTTTPAGDSMTTTPASSSTTTSTTTTTTEVKSPCVCPEGSVTGLMDNPAGSSNAPKIPCRCDAKGTATTPATSSSTTTTTQETKTP